MCFFTLNEPFWSFVVVILKLNALFISSHGSFENKHDKCTAAYIFLPLLGFTLTTNWLPLLNLIHPLTFQAGLWERQMSATLQSDETRQAARLSSFSSSEQLISDAVYCADTSSPQWITAHDTTSLSIKGRWCQGPDFRWQHEYMFAILYKWKIEISGWPSSCLGSSEWLFPVTH